MLTQKSGAEETQAENLYESCFLVISGNIFCSSHVSESLLPLCCFLLKLIHLRCTFESLFLFVSDYLVACLSSPYFFKILPNTMLWTTCSFVVLAFAMVISEDITSLYISCFRKMAWEFCWLKPMLLN